MFVSKILVLLMPVHQFINCYNISISTSFNGSFKLLSALHSIIRINFLQDFSTLTIIKAMRDEKYGNDFIENLLRLTKEEFAIRIEKHHKVHKLRSRKKKYCLILLDDIEFFRTLDKSITSEAFSFRGFFLFVIDEYFGETQEIFATLWKKNIFNVNVVYLRNDMVKIVSFMPFGNASCDDTTPKLIAEYSNGSFSHRYESVFPNKFHSLFNCKLIVSTFDDHFSVERNRDVNGSYTLSGFDVDLLSELSKVLKFEAKLEFLEESEPWGKNFNNGTVTGALGEVAKGKAQIAIGRFYLLGSRRSVADSSVVYYSFPAVFVVPPGRSLNDFEKLLQPFDAEIWISLLTVLIVALLVIATINLRLKNLKSFVFGSNNRHPTMNLMIVIIGGTQSNMPKRNFSRFLLLMFVILCLVLRSAYVGSLYNFLQLNKYYNKIDTIEELVEQNYDLYMYKSEEFNDWLTRKSKRYAQKVCFIFLRKLHSTSG